MEISKTELEGVLLIKPDIFEDCGGDYVEIYNEEFYRRNGSDANRIYRSVGRLGVPSLGLAYYSTELKTYGRAMSDRKENPLSL